MKRAAPKSPEERFLEKFPLGWKDFPRHLDDIIRSAMRRHRSLRGVFQIADTESEDDIQGLLDAHGLSHYEVHTGDFVDEAPARPEPGTGGATMYLISSATGEFGTVIFMRTLNDQATVELQSLAVAMLCHELGHVNDFETRRNIVPGEPLDLIAAEVYAHHFACRRMMQGNFRLPLYAYLEIIEKQHLTNESASVRVAAERFAGSGEFRTYKAFSDIHRFLSLLNRD